MEPENGTLGKGESYWKPSFPGSMLIFGGVFTVRVLAPSQRLDSTGERRPPWEVQAAWSGDDEGVLVEFAWKETGVDHCGCFQK